MVGRLSNEFTECEDVVLDTAEVISSSYTFQLGVNIPIWSILKTSFYLYCNESCVSSLIILGNTEKVVRYNLKPRPSGLWRRVKMEAPRTSETSASYHNTIRRQKRLESSSPRNP